MSIKYNKLIIHSTMGTQCAKLSPKTTTRSLPPQFESQESQISKCSEALHLEIKLQNLTLTNLIDIVQKIVFVIDDLFEVPFPKSEFHIQEKSLKWGTNHSGIFEIPGQQLDKKHMRVLIYDHKDKVAEKLEFKLTQLCSGPSRQDHLLQNMKARLAFDIRITQRVSINMRLSRFDLHFAEAYRETSQDFGYSICLKAGEDEQVFETEPIFANSKDIQCEALDVEILSHFLKEATVEIQIWKKEYNVWEKYPNRLQHYSDVYIPYQRIITDLYSSFVETGKQMQKRKVDFEEPIIVDGITKGSVSFQISHISSKLYVEQMQCLIFSQNGIGTISPQQIICEKQATLEISQLKQQLTNLKKLMNFTSQQKRDLKKSLINIYEFTKKNCKVSFSSNTELLNFQLTLVEILDIVAKIIRSGQDVINEMLWRIVNTIIHRPELTIRYIYFHFEEKQRIQISVKLLSFICKVMEKIVQSTTIGVTFHQLQCIQKFVAYAFFRLPWVQQSILKSFQKQNDPPINSDKLIQFGASLAAKSPSKSVVYDWETSVYKFVKDKQEFKRAMNELQQLAIEIPDWGKTLFNRKDDDLFYGMYIQIWNEAEKTLSYNGTVRWEYFPKYGELLAAFLGQMNKNPLTEYSSQFKECSLKLILNQRLLNSFMMLLFAKTCLFESYCVMKCLDLIKGYFEVITQKKRKIPLDFNFNYFYTGIKIILDSNHSYLLVKTLSLIYDYYNLFSLDFKMTLNAYILGKPFFALFLHWCGHVRKTFHYLLFFKIRTFFLQNHQQKSLKTTLNSIEDKGVQHQYDKLIHALQDLQSEVMKGEKKESLKETHYYLYMKQKIKKKMQDKISQQRKEPLKVSWNQEIQNRRKISEIKQTQFFKCRKWSVSSDEIKTHEIPCEKKKYVICSMKEFREIMKESNPNENVYKIEKMFSEGGVSIDS